MTTRRTWTRNRHQDASSPSHGKMREIRPKASKLTHRGQDTKGLAEIIPTFQVRIVVGCVVGLVWFVVGLVWCGSV